MDSTSFKDITKRSLIFVSGKGGVGKTVLSEALAHCLSSQGKKTLWVTFEDPSFPPGEILQRDESLSHLNCDGHRAFEEYIQLKIKIPALARIFLRNRAIEFLSKASPGVHELVLLGKVWSLRNEYNHIVCDMPSTGYGLAMFQSVQNFSNLFHTGKVRKDADAMYESLADPNQSGNIIVGLPEEMPLQEGIELNAYLSKLFPKNPSAFLVNRCYPNLDSSGIERNPENWKTPLAKSTEEYLKKRSIREQFNLELWKKKSFQFEKIEEAPTRKSLQILENLSSQFSRVIQ